MRTKLLNYSSFTFLSFSIETNNLTTPFICVLSESKVGGYFDFCSITHRQENVAEQSMYVFFTGMSAWSCSPY